MCTHNTALIQCSHTLFLFPVIIPPSSSSPFFLVFRPFYSADLNYVGVQWAQGESSPLLSFIQLSLASGCSIDLWGPSTCLCVYASVCVCVCPLFIRVIKVSSSLISHLSLRAVSLYTHLHTHRLSLHI